MTDQDKSFAELFEREADATPARRSVQVGDRVRGPVVQVGRDQVFIALDAKRQAYMEAVELRGPDGEITVKVGDELEALVVEVDHRSGEVKLGRSAGKPSSLAALEEALGAGLPIEGKVTGVNRGGLEVDLHGARGFCPISQADNRYVADPAALVGRALEFLVTEIRDGGKDIVLSRRRLLERTAREAADRIMGDLTPGAVVSGTVTSVRDFGAFVDLGGIEGLVPASQLSFDRSARVEELVSPGDSVRVQVQRVEHVKPKRPGDSAVKITLSLKALAADPWDAIDSVAPLGRIVAGTITRLTDFGAFVQLAPGVEGLLHISELPGKVDHPSSILRQGQPLTVVVRGVDREAKRIALVPAPDGSVVGTASTAPQLVIGGMVHGLVDRVESYGVFVQVDGTKGRAGRGLVPASELGVSRGTDLRKHFKLGASVTAKVLETGEGKLKLSIRAVKEDAERAQYDDYREKSAAPAKLGTLADLLKKHVDRDE